MTLDIGQCYGICVCMCYVFSCCARVMFLLLVCVLCRLSSVLCAGFSLCYVQFAVTNLVASLRACLASLAWLASLAAGASRPQDPLRNFHAVTAAFAPLLLKLAHVFIYMCMCIHICACVYSVIAVHLYVYVCVCIHVCVCVNSGCQ